jgi:hypothetical protein
MKNNRDRLTLVFKQNTDHFLLKRLIQTKGHENSDLHQERHRYNIKYLPSPNSYNPQRTTPTGSSLPQN